MENLNTDKLAELKGLRKKKTFQEHLLSLGSKTS